MQCSILCFYSTMCTWRLLCGVWVGNGTHGFCRSFIVCGVVDLFATGSSFDRSEAYLYINNDDIYIIHVDRRQNLTTTTIIKKKRMLAATTKETRIWYGSCNVYRIKLELRAKIHTQIELWTRRRTMSGNIPSMGILVYMAECCLFVRHIFFDISVRKT